MNQPITRGKIVSALKAAGYNVIANDRYGSTGVVVGGKSKCAPGRFDLTLRYSALDANAPHIAGVLKLCKALKNHGLPAYVIYTGINSMQVMVGHPTPPYAIAVNALEAAAKAEAKKVAAAVSKRKAVVDRAIRQLRGLIDAVGNEGVYTQRDRVAVIRLKEVLQYFEAEATKE